MTEIAGKDGDGPVTVYYPSRQEAQTLKRGPFTFQFAWQGAPVRGNGRLIVMSHGSGGSPWAHSDLARTLVENGFVVAMPEHRVGMYGMSAGGHTALSLAGGRWSPAKFKEHCDAHIAEDFQSCVGLATRLKGGLLDGPKKTLALWVHWYRFRDATWRAHTDPRVAAVVAAVPFAADFDMTSLAKPPVPLALVTARKDAWLIPRFHGDRVLQACATCERLADFATGGHGALLSPLPPGLSGLVGDLLNDPPGFNRSELPAVDQKIAEFFRKRLLPSVTSVARRW